MARKVVTMGEIMLRLAPHNNKRFVQANEFQAIYGGGEANVAISLATFGFDAYFVTKLPKNEIGQSAVNELRQFGVNTEYISRGGERIGIYFLEMGAAMRPSKIIYDRKDSAMAKADCTDFDFDKIFRNTDWFHFSGITPALSKEAANLTEETLKHAKKAGVVVSVDINYRKKLWTIPEASACMTKLMPYVDVFIGGESDMRNILGIQSDQQPNEKNINTDLVEKTMKTFGFKYIVSTQREVYSADYNGWKAYIYDGKEYWYSKKYDIQIVERVGAGDSFAAGIIYGMLEKETTQEALEFAVGASALKHTIPGDSNLVTVDEVNDLIDGEGNGRVQR